MFPEGRFRSLDWKWLPIKYTIQLQRNKNEKMTAIPDAFALLHQHTLQSLPYNKFVVPTDTKKDSLSKSSRFGKYYQWKFVCRRAFHLWCVEIASFLCQGFCLNAEFAWLHRRNFSALTWSRASIINSSLETISGFSGTTGCWPSIASQWANVKRVNHTSELENFCLPRMEISKGVCGNEDAIIRSNCISRSSIYCTSRWLDTFVVLNVRFSLDKRDPTIGYEKKNDSVLFGSLLRWVTSTWWNWIADWKSPVNIFVRRLFCVNFNASYWEISNKILPLVFSHLLAEVIEQDCLFPRSKTSHIRLRDADIDSNQLDIERMTVQIEFAHLQADWMLSSERNRRLYNLQKNQRGYILLFW